MDAFLRNNWPKLTPTQLQKLHTYYPQGHAYPDSGAYWSAAALAYGEIRYICPGIYLSSVHFRDAPKTGSWNYHWDVLSAANNASGFGVTHTAELASIWGYSSAPDSELIPSIQAYWTSFIRTWNPNTYKLKSAPEWKRVGKGESGFQRLYLGNGVDVRMERAPGEQWDRCEYLSGIGVSIGQ
jgi:carboxylesterase type B